MIRILALMAFATPAAAHSWYASSCCSGRDCAPILMQQVSVDPGGWHIRLRAGDHPFVSTDLDELIPYDDGRIKKSEDGDFHICINSSQRILCVYVPEFGS